MKMRICRQSARPKTGVRSRGWRIAALCLLGCAVFAPAFGEEPDPASLRVVVVAKFALPQVTQPLAGSREAVVAAAWQTAGEARLLTQAQWEALHLEWAALLSQAPAASWKSAGEPELIRDGRGVLDCAVLHSREPGGDLTGALFAPEFLRHFSPLFGSKLLVAIPDRSTLFVFPRLASRYQDYAGRVLAVYRAAAHPVSREVYELSSGGLRAIGAYEE